MKKHQDFFMQVKLIFFFFVTLYKYVQIHAGPFGTIPGQILEILDWQWSNLIGLFQLLVSDSFTQVKIK